MNYHRYILYTSALILFLSIIESRIQYTFNNHSGVHSSQKLTGAKAALAVLIFYDITYVKIECVPGRFTDRFDPKRNAVCLSDAVYNSTSILAIGFACHQAGHAVQHINGYPLVLLRNFLTPIVSVTSKIALPLYLFGFFFRYEVPANIGIILFIFTLLFESIMFPVERNANKYAFKAVREGIFFNNDEIKGVKKVLKAVSLRDELRHFVDNFAIRKRFGKYYE